MKRTTTYKLENECKVETFGLTEKQHDMVVEMVKADVDKCGNYTLEEVDADLWDAWIDNAKQEGNEEYEEFLAEAQLCDAATYTLFDNIGEWSQPIGEVSIYYF
jgi:hypothetical protein